MGLTDYEQALGGNNLVWSTIGFTQHRIYVYNCNRVDRSPEKRLSVQIEDWRWVVTDE